MQRRDNHQLLAAIDLDGTFFGPDSRPSPDNLAAMEKLATHGFAIALASGRHPRNMADIAASLPLVSAMVSTQGGEVSDATRQRIHKQVFMDSDAVTMVALAGIELGLGVIAYTADGELTPADGPEIERYRKLVHTDVPVTHLATLAADRVFKVMWIASEQRLDEVISAGAHLPCKPRSADFVRSHREVFEYNPCGVSKASGMAVLAAHHGVPANRVAAFGDADNDVPLFRWAGFSVAMPHAKPHVRNQATITAPEGPPETAFARGVDVLLSNVWIQERA